ncbi:hypothetical protein PoB_002324300, partial [Plakobranchus ocellatus]
GKETKAERSGKAQSETFFDFSKRSVQCPITLSRCHTATEITPVLLFPLPLATHTILCFLQRRRAASHLPLAVSRMPSLDFQRSHYGPPARERKRITSCTSGTTVEHL